VEFAPGTPDVGTHYRHARVHAVPSWFETTGLVSLEAAIAGCNIVSTSRGHAREYLGELAWYCDPDSKKSIRSAVLAAWEASEQSALRDRVLDHFTWEHAARATLNGYMLVIASRRR
jgi:glycosyltransferase involved in cell wall biosynthesis